MAGNLQLYALIYVTVNGKLLTEEASMSMRRITGAQIQKTVAKGFAGVSPGARMMTGTFKNAVPASDYELDPTPFMVSLTPVELGLVGPGGKRAMSKGFILDDTLEHAVDNAATLVFEYTGTFPKWV